MRPRIMVRTFGRARSVASPRNGTAGPVADIALENGKRRSGRGQLYVGPTGNGAVTRHFDAGQVKAEQASPTVTAGADSSRKAAAASTEAPLRRFPLALVVKSSGERGVDHASAVGQSEVDRGGERCVSHFLLRPAPERTSEYHLP